MIATLMSGKVCAVKLDNIPANEDISKYIEKNSNNTNAVGFFQDILISCSPKLKKLFKDIPQEKRKVFKNLYFALREIGSNKTPDKNKIESLKEGMENICNDKNFIEKLKDSLPKELRKFVKNSPEPIVENPPEPIVEESPKQKVEMTDKEVLLEINKIEEVLEQEYAIKEENHNFLSNINDIEPGTYTIGEIKYTVNDKNPDFCAYASIGENEFALKTDGNFRVFFKKKDKNVEYNSNILVYDITTQKLNKMEFISKEGLKKPPYQYLSDDKLSMYLYDGKFKKYHINEDKIGNKFITRKNKAVMLDNDYKIIGKDKLNCCKGWNVGNSIDLNKIEITPQINMNGTSITFKQDDINKFKNFKTPAEKSNKCIRYCSNKVLLYKPQLNDRFVLLQQCKSQFKSFDCYKDPEDGKMYYLKKILIGSNSNVKTLLPELKVVSSVADKNIVTMNLLKDSDGKFYDTTGNIIDSKVILDDDKIYYCSSKNMKKRFKTLSTIDNEELKTNFTENSTVESSDRESLTIKKNRFCLNLNLFGKKK